MELIAKVIFVFSLPVGVIAVVWAIALRRRNHSNNFHTHA